MITVKVIRVPGTVKELGLQGDTITVNDALNEAGLSLNDGEALQINGQAATLETVLQDKDIVVLAKGAKGAL